MSESSDDLQALRRLVHVRADFHLSNWGRWRRGYYGPMGYGSKSAGFAGGGYSRDFEDIEEEADSYAAKVSDAIIEGLDVLDKVALQHVYEASVWRFARLSLEDRLVEAAGRFWIMACKRGLT